jgi:hypothetical protein
VAPGEPRVLNLALRIRLRLNVWLVMHRRTLKNQGYLPPAHMTLDEKIRYGMLALSGASLVFATLGLRIGPLEIIGGYGTH